MKFVKTTIIRKGGNSAINFMSEKNIKRLHIAYSAVLSVLLTVCAVLFAVSCVGIYNSTESEPYTTQTISAAFKRIAPPVCICLILILGGFILNLFIPAEKKKLKGGVSKSVTLSRLSSKLDLDNTLVEYGAGILIRRRVRHILTAFASLIFILRSVHTLIYILNTENFPAADINGEVIKATLTVLLNLLIPFIIAITVSFVNSKLIKDEIELTKKALAQQKNKYEAPEKENFITKAKAFFIKNDKKLVFATRVIIIFVGIIFVGAGILNGGASDVVQKAIKICTECIGLG